MSGDATGMAVAYLCAAMDGTDIKKDADKQAVISLRKRGLLDDACRLTNSGRLVAEDTIQAFARAAVWYAARRS